MVDGGVLDGCKHADKVDAPMIIESLVFCIYESFPEFGIDLLIFHRSAVFIEILAYHHAVGTVYLGCLTADGVLYLAIAWRLAKQP